MNKYIKEYQELHTNLDFSKSVYINSRTKIQVECPKHGVFEIRPSHLKQGAGCKKCSFSNMGINNTLCWGETLDEFKRIHDGVYTYPNFTKDTKFKNTTKINISCKIHGEFSQTIQAHKVGQGCPKCKKGNIKPFKVFKQEAHELFGGIYQYEEHNYTNMSTKMVINCIEHGDFEQLPITHLRSIAPCPKCNAKHLSDVNKPSVKQRISEFREVHGDNYDYKEFTGYKNKHDQIPIICKKHGLYYQRLGDHKNSKCGCPKCSNGVSKGEQEIFEWLSGLGKTQQRVRSILGGKELDILFEGGVGVEYNGLYWHSEIHKHKDYHIQKTQLCEENGIQLIHIFEDEWVLHPNKVKSLISSKIGKGNRIFARKTIVAEVDNKQYKKFCEKNHMQSYAVASVRLGLYHNTELVAVMSFSKLRNCNNSKGNDGEFEMIRFCNKLNTNVVGGASKLMKFFERNFDPVSVLSYANLRYSKGVLYEKLGFIKVSQTNPNYFWCKGLQREHRYNHTKHKLVERGYDPNKTEIQIMHDLGYFRVFDCGNLKYLKTY